MSKYTVYSGKFLCHTCKDLVTSLRSYPETKELTWMCKDKHMTRVDLNTKRSKKDYE